MKRTIAMLSLLLATIWGGGAFAASADLVPGRFNEFNVELPVDLRRMAGRGTESPVAHARVTIAVPPKLDMAHIWPVLVVSATSDAAHHSSRELLRAYAETAVAAGWIVIAADPAETIAFEQDGVALRLALNTAALAVLELQWKGADKAPLAFGGFSGGAKHSGWLAAAFASKGRRVVGVYLAGVNEDPLVPAATLFNLLTPAFKLTPVFLQAGQSDAVAPLITNQQIAADLRRAGFRNVRLVSFDGAHVVEPGPLRTALDWFREFATIAPDR